MLNFLKIVLVTVAVGVGKKLLEEIFDEDSNDEQERNSNDEL